MTLIMLTQYSFSIVSVGVIVAAVRDWSDGRYTKAGCNLKFILDWAWARVVEIKVSLILSVSIKS